MYQAPDKVSFNRHRYVMLGEDQDYYYLMDELGFFKKMGKMFKRMVKITPKSFRPGNIFRAATNTALTAVTGGAYLVLPTKIKKQIEEIGKVAVPIIAGGIAAAYVGPAVMGILGPKMTAAGGLLDKHGSEIGGRLLSSLIGMGPTQQAQVAEQVTPQQIADMERTGQIPPELQTLMHQLARQTVMPPPPPPLPMTLAPPSPEAAPVAEAGLLGGGGMMLFVGLSVVGLVLFGMPKGRK